VCPVVRVVSMTKGIARDGKICFGSEVCFANQEDVNLMLG